MVMLLLSVPAEKVNGVVLSPIYGVGNPVFRDIPEVSILSERLYIKLGHGHSDIKVKYILWNNTNKDYKNIDYAFPVDFVNEYYDQYKDPLLVDYVEFVADGKTLVHTSGPGILMETLTNEKSDKYKAYGWSSISALYRKWFYTKVSIPRHSFMTLEVNYSVNSPYYDYDAAPPYEYDAGTINILNYDFSPVSRWHDGIIRDFYIQIDASELNISGLNTMLKPMVKNFEPIPTAWDPDIRSETIWVSGLQFKGDGPVYTCHIRNFDLTKSEPLHVTYHHPSSFNTLMDCYVPHNAYKMTFSSEQNDYPVKNLTDMNLATAWVPTGKGGIGDWVEFDFKEKDTLDRLVSIFFVNGYHKDQASYEQNNRVKRLEVTITYYESSHYREGEVRSGFYNLPDAPYQSVNLMTIPYQSVYLLEEPQYQGYEKNTSVFDINLEEFPVKRIRLTIVDIYKGTKYDDTCISEILLYRFLGYNRYLPAFYDRYRKK